MTTEPKSQHCDTRLKTKRGRNRSIAQSKTDDEIWDELLARPESRKILQQLAAEALDDHQKGLTEEGGFGF